jgi:hypothetical protein
MKKFILGVALVLFATAAIGDPYGHSHGREHNEWHQRGGHFGWGEFVGGIILGSIVAHQVDGHYYDNSEAEVRRITLCDNIYLYDQYGRFIRTERQCHDEWVRVEQ